MANKTDKTTEKVENKTKETTEKVEKTAIVKIPLERGKKNDDVYVAVNGRTWQIKRGVDVEVPERVAEALRLSEEQLFKAYEYQDAMSSN